MSDPKTKGTLILIVEDNPIIGSDLEDQFAAAGLETTWATNADEAKRLAARHEPALAVVDVDLGEGKDGITFVEELRADRNALPIVFLTAQADDQNFKRAQQVGPRAFLAKPFRSRDLLRTVLLTINHSPATVTPTSGGESYGDRIFVPDRDKLVRLIIDDMLYVQAADYYCTVVSRTGTTMVTTTLKAFLTSLPAGHPIFRIHRSYAVNLRHVGEITAAHLTVEGHRLPLSRNKREVLLRLITGS